jgi:hypothetical protein
MLGPAAAEGYLPALEQCPELPEEFQQPETIEPKTEVDQRTTPFDPMAAGAVPRERNADGTLAGGSVRHPFEGTRTAVVPRTDAEELAARRKVAEDLEAVHDA